MKKRLRTLVLAVTMLGGRAYGDIIVAESGRTDSGAVDRGFAESWS
jgi:hypothetical protein